MTNYAFNANSARAGDSGGNRITDTGAYVGVFTRAEDVLSKKDTKGIEFTFEAQDKRSADFLNLWTINAQGEQIFGYEQLMALMACLKLRSITPQQGQVEKYDNGERRRVTATIYPELMNKPIGVLLQKEPYIKGDGKPAYKFNFAGFFDPATRLTASEMLDKVTKPERLDRMLAGLKDKPMKDNRGGNSGSHAPAGGGQFEDDDIPW